MKRIMHMAIILMGFGSLASCDKDVINGTSDKDTINNASDIIGEWSPAGNAVYYDGNKIEFNMTELGIYCLMEDNSTLEFYDPMSGSIGTMVTYNFDKDGGLYVFGMKVGEWRYADGKASLTYTDIGESVSLSISDGFLNIENDSAQVFGYQFREMFNYEPIKDWLGYDGNLHEIKYVTRLKK